MAAATIRPMTGPRAMTEVEIAVAVAEIADATVDGVIMRVRQPMPDHLAISVRKAGKHHEFVVGVAAGMARIHLARNLPPTPPGPSAFTLRARKLMRPARLVAVEQVAGDRIVRIRISGHREADGRWQSSLIAELFGRGRLLLLDADDRVLAWHGPGGGRGLVVGAPYTAPPAARHAGAGGADGSAGVNSDTLEARYEAWFAARDQAAQAHARSVRFEQACKRTERRIAAMRRDLKKLTGWQRWEREGELLSAHRHLMRRGMERVTVTDWYADDCAERVILLDPGRTPDENIEARFKRMRKAKKGMPLLEGRIAEAEKELNRLLREGPVALPEPADQAPFGGGKQEVAHFRRFRAADGWEVYVGRSATENDRLTFRFARGNDLWFHARDVPGSHVLLRGRGEAPQHVVLQAALLAAHFSRLKKEGGGEVMYTPRKYLKRPRGGSPGQVLVTQERVLDVGLETEALAQLLAARIP